MAIKLSHELVDKLIEGWDAELKDAVPPRWSIKYQWELIDNEDMILLFTTNTTQFVEDSITLTPPNLYTEVCN